MPRPTIPAPLACAQLALRILDILTTLGALTNALWLSITFSHHNAILYVGLIWVLALDNAEVIALTSKPGQGPPRAHLCPLLTAEVLGIVFFLIGFAVGSEYKGLREESGVFVEAGRWLTYGILILHGLLMVVCLIDGCKYGRVRRRHRRLRQQRERAHIRQIGRREYEHFFSTNRNPIFAPLDEFV